MKFFALGTACALAFASVPPLLAQAEPSQTETETTGPSFTEVNEAMGLPLFSATDFWSEEIETVAKRLRWPQESQTSTSASYRLYPRPAQPVFQRKAFSLVLHGEDGSPVSLSLVFANKGDIDGLIGVGPDARAAEIRRAESRAERDYKRLIREDAAALTEALNGLFGPAQNQRLGGSSQTAERAQRWDWNGVSFLLAAPREEYVTLRIVPTAGLDEGGSERIARRDLREELLNRIERRENGDVILRDIPMVNQGPKGYCVPATWERVLRYMGIPADMYVLAMAGGTQVGGGTVVRDIAQGASQLVTRQGRRIQTERIRLIPSSVAASIDRGIPLMWAMFVVEPLNSEITRRSKERQKVTDWTAWQNDLRPHRMAARSIRPDPTGGHVCMIIGYNRETGEIAISDSWGPEFAERWLTLEEAEAISQGSVTSILP
jgi:hypothetical protein